MKLFRGGIVKQKTMGIENELKDDCFERQLQAEIDKLPFETGADDGGFNHGRVAGFEEGARWRHKLVSKKAGNVIETSSQKYTFKIYNGRIKVYCDGYVMFSFNQIDFSGYYAYKNDEKLYGIDVYMNREKAGHQIIEVYFKTKETWLAISRLLDENL